MSRLFHEKELLKAAIKIEENGCRFYTSMAGHLTKAPVKEMLEFLAQQEKGHIKAFTHLLESVAPQAVNESFPGEEDEYLQALANDSVFVNDEEVNKKISSAASDLDVIVVALGFEKDSILFYLQMLPYISEERQGPIKELIRQEKEHLIKLSAMKATIVDIEKLKS